LSLTTSNIKCNHYNSVLSHNTNLKSNTNPNPNANPINVYNIHKNEWHNERHNARHLSNEM